MWTEVFAQMQEDVQKLMAKGGTFTLYEAETSISVIDKVDNLIRICNEKSEMLHMKGNAIAFLEWSKKAPLSLEETGQILQTVVAATKSEPLTWDWRETEKTESLHLYVIAEVESPKKLNN